MEKDLYFLIFQRLAEAGLYNSVSINDIFKDHFIKTGISKTKGVNWYTLPYDMLEPLVAKDYLHYIRQHQEETGPVPDNWVDHISVIATLHPEGLLFYYQQIQIKELIKANKYNKWNILATAFLAFSGLVFTIYMGLRNINSDKKDKRMPNSQSLRKKQDSTIEKPLLGPKAFHPDSSRK